MKKWSANEGKQLTQIYTENPQLRGNWGILILNPEFLVLQFYPAGGTQSQHFAYIISFTPGKPY